MPVNHPLHSGQANARSGELAGFVQALEGREKHSGVGHIKTHAVIANEKGRAAFGSRLAKLNPCRGARAGELYGVSEQVGQRDLQKPGVARAFELRSYHEFDGAVRMRL